MKKATNPKKQGSKKSCVKPKLKKKKQPSIASLKKQTQAVFNKWLLIQKPELICIACGEPKNKVVCGHFFGTHNYNWMRYIEDNCWPECGACNSFSHESLIGYTINLQKKLGQERFDKLVEESKVRKPEFTRTELLRLKEYYKTKCTTA
jgi:hypothetical protein